MKLLIGKIFCLMLLLLCTTLGQIYIKRIHDSDPITEIDIAIDATLGQLFDSITKELITNHNYEKTSKFDYFHLGQPLSKRDASVPLSDIPIYPRHPDGGSTIEFKINHRINILDPSECDYYTPAITENYNFTSNRDRIRWKGNLEIDFFFAFGESKIDPERAMREKEMIEGGQIVTLFCLHYGSPRKMTKKYVAPQKSLQVMVGKYGMQFWVKFHKPKSNKLIDEFHADMPIPKKINFFRYNRDHEKFGKYNHFYMNLTDSKIIIMMNGVKCFEHDRDFAIYGFDDDADDSYFVPSHLFRGHHNQMQYISVRHFCVKTSRGRISQQKLKEMIKKRPQCETRGYGLTVADLMPGGRHITQLKVIDSKNTTHQKSKSKSKCNVQ